MPIAEAERCFCDDWMQVWILCNDCSATSSVRFHVLGQKCPRCSSYNTRETRAR